MLPVFTLNYFYFLFFIMYSVDGVKMVSAYMYLLLLWPFQSDNETCLFNPYQY